MSVWNLLWIVPLAGMIGAAVMACIAAGDDPCEDCPYREDDEEEEL